MKKLTVALVALLMIEAMLALSCGASGVEVKQGLWYEEDGEVRYYVDGVPVHAGLVEGMWGELYYINSTCKAVKSCEYRINYYGESRLFIANDAGMLSFVCGFHEDEDGVTRYYDNGYLVYAGLTFEDGGYLYYVNSACRMVRSCEYAVSKKNGIEVPDVLRFDARGRAYIALSGDGSALYIMRDWGSACGYKLVWKGCPDALS